MQTCLTDFDIKDCADKIRLLKNQVELGAVLDALYQHGVVGTLLNGTQISIDQLAQKHNLPTGFLAVCLKCLWFNDLLAADAQPNNILLSHAGIKICKAQDKYVAMQAAIVSVLNVYQTENASLQILNLKNFSDPHSPWLLLWLFLLSHKNNIHAAPFAKAVLTHLYPNSEWQISEDIIKQLVTLSPIVFHTLSYLPSYANVLHTWQSYQSDNKQQEQHLDRQLDLHTSASVFQGAIAEVFFEKIKQRFNHLLFMHQPNYIIDLGCGNGEVLEKIYHYIANHTLRGQVLDSYPIHLIGVDYHLIARQQTEQRLAQLTTHYHVLEGDINQPAAIWQQLKALNIHPEQALHICKSVIHDCEFLKDISFISSSTDEPTTKAQPFYCYSSADNSILSHTSLADKLHAHFCRWQPYISQFGYLVIEAHNGFDVNFNPAELTQSNKSNLTTLNLSHDLSHQYLIDQATFQQALLQSGLTLNSYQPLQKIAGHTTLALYDINQSNQDEGLIC
jgi:SAM-dependent methyltransferase